MLDKTYFFNLKSEYVFSILNTSISKEIKEGQNKNKEKAGIQGG